MSIIDENPLVTVERAVRAAVQAERERLLQIAWAEYAYWRDAEEAGDPDGTSGLILDGIQMGAMGAAANLVAAFAGHLAPWHKAASESVTPTTVVGNTVVGTTGAAETAEVCSE